MQGPEAWVVHKGPCQLFANDNNLTWIQSEAVSELAMADDTQNSIDITTVSIPGKDSIRCGFHLVPYIVRIVVETIPASTYVLITDTNVANYHLDKFQDAFASFLPSKASSSRFFTHIIPPGEISKSREGKASIEDYLLVRFVAATLYVPISLTSAPTLRRNVLSACGEYVSCRFLPLSLPWSIQALEERRQSIPRQKPRGRVLAARVHLHRRCVS